MLLVLTTSHQVAQVLSTGVSARLQVETEHMLLQATWTPASTGLPLQLPGPPPDTTSSIFLGLQAIGWERIGKNQSFLIQTFPKFQLTPGPKSFLNESQEFDAFPPLVTVSVPKGRTICKAVNMLGLVLHWRMGQLANATWLYCVPPL